MGGGTSRAGEPGGAAAVRSEAERARWAGQGSCGGPSGLPSALTPGSSVARALRVDYTLWRVIASSAAGVASERFPEAGGGSEALGVQREEKGKPEREQLALLRKKQLHGWLKPES